MARRTSPAGRYTGGRGTFGDTARVFVRPVVIAVVLAGTLLGACGGGDDEPADEPDTGIAGDADPGDVQVIDEWAKTLASGDVEGAAKFFAIPSVAENGILVEIEDEDDALRFNASLPCGAELIAAESEGEFTTATFRLTERPGRGKCGDGTGETAQTTFVIEGSKIVEWRRVGLPGEEPSGQVT
jgi:hypothetical protein